MFPVLRHCFTRRIFCTLMFELLALTACFSVLLLTNSVWSQAEYLTVWTVVFAFINTCLVQFALWSFGLYSREVVYSGRRMMSNLAGSFVFSAILLLPSSFLFSWSGVRVFDVGFTFYLVGLVGFMSLVALERTVVLRKFNDTPYLGNMLILGTGPVTDQVVAEARRNHGKTFRLVGVLSEDPGEVGRSVDGCQVVGSIGDIDQVVREQDVRGIIISMPVHSPLLPTDFLLKCKLKGIVVKD